MTKKFMLMAMSASLFAVPAMAAQASPQKDPNAQTTRAEAQAKAEQMFDRLDVNKDATLDDQDRAAWQQQRQDARFAKLDGNKDGNISKEEWDQANSERKAKSAERRTNHRAKAGRTEHRVAGKRGGGMRFGGKAMTGTKAEFVARSLARFDAMDADKDGVVTAAERTAARQAMREQRKQNRPAVVNPAQ